MIRLLNFLGRWFGATYPGRLITLLLAILGAAIWHSGSRRSTFKTLVGQIYFTGVEAFPQVALLAMVVGALTILQAVTIMPKLGGGDALGGVMVAVVIREIGPLLTALFIAGRSGSAFSTLLGNMKVMQEIDGLRVMGINPLQYLILPSFFATLVSLLCLTLIFDLVAVLGGFVIVGAIDIANPGLFEAQLSLGLFTEKIFLALRPMDMGLAFLKPLIFGTAISVIACFHGLEVGTDVRAVPRATRMTVVHSFILIIVSDLLLALPFLISMKEKLIL